MLTLRRSKAAELNERSFDFLVVGGGITGSGVAQDAASRGFTVLLVDKGDFASGTSSKSSKLIHGGLRYLANLQFAVTIESLAERSVQQQIAPHLVWAMPFTVPIYHGNLLANLKLRCGLMLYDLLAGRRNKLRHKAISSAEVLSLYPGIRRKNLKGGLLYYDCRTDDSRHTLELLRSAVEHGAEVCNYMSLQSSIKSSSGKLQGAWLKDEITGNIIRVNAKQIVNATGIWTGLTSKCAGARFDAEVLASKGVHICVRRERLPIGAAAVIPSVRDSRFIFAVPWYDRVLIGTTDSAYQGGLDKPLLSEDEQNYMLEAVNSMFPHAGLAAQDIVGRYAGLRPLLKSNGRKSTADLSRQHSLQLSPEGLISIAGGKLTTYRLMAEETVDLALKCMLGRNELPANRQRCRTAEIMLGGFSSGDDCSSILADLEKQALSLGLNEDTARYLPRVYGKRCSELFQMLQDYPHLAERIADGHPYIMAQVLYAVKYEAA
ncbi:MAG: glycerol-3-phosphate dehydrogenase/oxidase, partial [Candidatus Obscuribacterales bacterium]|nr:glycerol-3-phosphate dehydrogenase/oxidase [Candidatus Obscuribacterales bacterium]